MLHHLHKPKPSSNPRLWYLTICISTPHTIFAQHYPFNSITGGVSCQCLTQNLFSLPVISSSISVPASIQTRAALIPQLFAIHKQFPQMYNIQCQVWSQNIATLSIFIVRDQQHLCLKKKPACVWEQSCLGPFTFWSGFSHSRQVLTQLYLFTDGEARMAQKRQVFPCHIFIYPVYSSYRHYILPLRFFFLYRSYASVLASLLAH